MWFTYALITALAWGLADLFYKKGTDSSDKLSHLKIVVMVGFVMGIHGFLYMGINHITFSPWNLILYLPVSFMYILSMTIGYVGLRYIELSISSPVQNSSGVVAALLCFIFLGQRMTSVQLMAVALICSGIFLLSLFEKKEADKVYLTTNKHIDSKYRIGFLAIIFPILYCIIDGLGTFLDAIYLDANAIMSEDTALLSYEFTFLICAVIALFYITIIKKEKFNVFKEKDKGIAAIFEMSGQFFYVFAMADYAIITAPLVASYSIVSIILSRIFLKEKLAKKQYLVIALVMVGIAILGIEQ